MNSTYSPNHRTGPELTLFERLDEQLRSWARANGGQEHQYPSLIDAETLRRAEYPAAFPHLLMAAAVARDAAAPWADDNTLLAPWFLSPAVCYHTYASFAGEILPQGRVVTARGCCFRHEDAAELIPGRRQVEFAMRELIFVGAPNWLEERLESMPGELEVLAATRGLAATWQAAHDPFFLPTARGKSHVQRLLGTKRELCLADGLAIASINRHRSFFGERFDIRLADGSPAHSACVAFGLDRWAAHQVANEPGCAEEQASLTLS